MTKEERELLFDILSKMEQLKPDQQERVLQFVESLTIEEKKRFKENASVWEQIKDSNLICR